LCGRGEAWGVKKKGKKRILPKETSLAGSASARTTRRLTVNVTRRGESVTRTGGEGVAVQTEKAEGTAEKGKENGVGWEGARQQKVTMRFRIKRPKSVEERNERTTISEH